MAKKVYIIKFRGLLKEAYIGETLTPLSDRLGRHIRSAFRNDKSPKDKWLSHYIDNGLKVYITELHECTIFEDSTKIEKAFIKLYKSLGYILHNSNGGGTGGNPLSIEGREKIVKFQKTQHLKPIVATNLLTNEQSEFKSLTEASNLLNIPLPNISKCLKGKRVKTKGYKFKYQYNGK